MDFHLLDLRNIFIVFRLIHVKNTKLFRIQKTLATLFFNRTATYNNPKIS